MLKRFILLSLLSLQGLCGEINGMIRGNKGGLEDYSSFIVYIKEGETLPKLKNKKGTYEDAQVNKTF